MRPLPTPEEMAAADRAAIAAGTPAEVLMDRAGRAVAYAVLRRMGCRYGRRVVVVCGKGNNGGDGFVAARVLHSEGVAVRCLSLADPESFSGAAAYHLGLAASAGVDIGSFDPRPLERADVVVDAIFGTGFSGVAKGQAAAAIASVAEAGADIVAVDIPSGLDGLTGTAHGPVVRADATVAMGAVKIGCAVAPGALYAGDVEVADIGITVTEARAWLAEAPDAAACLPRRALDAHKRAGGSVAVLAGSQGMSGAALLCARGAARMGAGYVTLGTTRYVDHAKAAMFPEVLSQVISDTDVLGPDAVKRFHDVLERADAVALGPGLGTRDEQRGLVEEVLAGVEVPVVVDADGLNVLAADTAVLERRRGPCIITPHPGEIGRLLGMTAADVQRDRVGAARTAAARFGCVVLLKGYRTIVASPEGTLVVDPAGGPELATAGTGDVLTGALAALVAQSGADASRAAVAAAYVHGVAGSVAAERIGASVLAWDVAESLPAATARVASEAG